LDTKIQDDSSDTTAAMNDLKSMQQALQDAQAQAVHASVKAKLQQASTDLQSTINDFNALSAGTSTDATKLNTDLQQFETDGTAIDSLCSSF
jgi:hypothetical protein